MASPRDQNRIPTLRAALNMDGVSIVNITADPSTHTLSISNGTNGTNYTFINAQRDNDRVPVLLAVSASDGETPVEIYALSTGELLTTSV